MKDSALPNRPMQLTDPDVLPAREERLRAIRTQAETLGRVEGIGVRPAGSPMPIASVETGYYGIHLLKEPQWSWEIPVYFFAGGAAGAAAVIAEFAQWTGAEAGLVDDARTIAAIGSLLAPALLVSDLGVPSRFLNMLRVFKVQSPMSVGVYIVSGFGPASTAAKLANWLHARHPGRMLRVIEGTAGLFSALFGLGMATYTGVLIGVSAIPVWNENIDSLPIHFALSGLGAGVSAIELMGHENSRSLNMLGIAASLGESMEGVKLELANKPANEPLKKGVSGIITRLGGVLTGPLPLALRILAAFTGDSRSRQLRRVAAASTLAGSFCTRLGWVRAGHASAKDYRLPLQLDTKALSPGDAQARRKSSQVERFAEKSRAALGRRD
jgi:hypothetical protein